MYITIFTLRTSGKWSRELRNVVDSKLLRYSRNNVKRNLQNTKAEWKYFFPATQ